MLIIQKELRRDTLAVEFVEHYFAGDGRVVTVNYGDAIVKKHDYVRTQLYLSDGRRVRVDHVSGRSRGESASLFVTIENVVEATNTVGTN